MTLDWNSCTNKAAGCFQGRAIKFCVAFHSGLHEDKFNRNHCLEEHKLCLFHVSHYLFMLLKQPHVFCQKYVCSQDKSTIIQHRLAHVHRLWSFPGGAGSRFCEWTDPRGWIEDRVWMSCQDLKLIKYKREKCWRICCNPVNIRPSRLTAEVA